MSVYYVRVTGSDGAAGTSPATAWKTFGKLLGAAGMASGDTAYIGAGVYRETLVVAMTSATVETKIIGDTTGEFTGDAGVIRWTAWTTDDKTAPPATILLSLAGRDFLTFENIWFYGSSGAVATIASSTTGAATNITFRRCNIFVPPGSTSGTCINITSTGIPALSVIHWLIDSCVLWSSSSIPIALQYASSATGADWDLDVIVRNCLIVGPSSSGTCVSLTKSGANTFLAGGILVQNNTIITGNIAVRTVTGSSTTIPCKAYNNVIIACGSSAALTAANSGEIVEDYNLISATTARSNVSTGGSSQAAYAPLFNIGQNQIWGFLPHMPFSPTIDSPILGFGTDGSVSLAVDMTNRDRPSGGGPTWASALKGVGCLERHDFAVKESSVTDSGDGWKLTGPGDCDILVPVDATSTTIAIKGRYDTNHGTGSKPQAELVIGPQTGITVENNVAAQTLTMSVGVDTWETLTFSAFTPTVKSWVKIRLRSRSAAGNGLCYWDSLTVT